MRGSFALVLVVQIAVVSAVLLRALVMAHGQPREPGRPGAPHGDPALARSRGPAGMQASPTTAEVARAAAQLADLEAERSRLMTRLEHERSARSKEEVEFRARRREVALAVHRHRQAALELAAEEPDLREKVLTLRAEVEHLERRRPELADEIRASDLTSRVVHERITLARDELADLQRDHARIRCLLDEELQRLRDLVRRRALLQAETEALVASARAHQDAVDGSPLLSLVTDGELHASSAGPQSWTDGSSDAQARDDVAPVRLLPIPIGADRARRPRTKKHVAS
jgi:hypothetical protein